MIRHHPIKILLVEDNPGDVLLLQETLSEITFVDLELVHVERMKYALNRLQSEEFDVVLLDLVLPDSNGLDTFIQIHEQAPLIPIVVLTGMADETLAIRAMQAGAQDYLVKGQVSGSELLLRSIRYAIERKRIEAALKQREQELRTLTENAPDIIARFDQKLRYLYVNSAIEEATGLSVQDFLGKTSREVGLPEVQVEQWEEVLQRVFSTGKKTSIEYKFPTPSGVRYYQSQCVPEFAQDGSIASVLEITRDISDFKLAEQKIREQAALIEISPDAIVVCDLDRHILFWNQGAEQIYGWTVDEIMSQDVSKLSLQQSLPQIAASWQKLLQMGKWQGELPKVTKVGQEIQVSSRWKLLQNETGEAYAILMIDRDITEQKQLETQFLRAQRLESLGTLAGGIAHDLNNVLTPILGIAQLLPLKLPPLSEQNKGLLKILVDSSKRGSYMVKQILTFARGLEGDLVPLQISHLLVELEALCKSTFPKSIEIRLDILTRDLLLVSANATHLHQVFMNFSVNARDAMPHGGVLNISAENIVIDETYVRTNLEAKVGSYVVITFKDTGVGIPPEHIDRIFEPFFTTKVMGEGTGLGLSTAMGIIKNHSGFMTVSSQVDQGTQFQVFLPAIEITATASLEAPGLPSGHGELILVVDDEENIREMLKITLENYNYSVITANNGIEAIAAYTIQSNIKVVVLDMMMPLMDGTVAIQTLKQFDPQIKIIACSGIAGNASLCQSFGVKDFLSKPFTTDDLLNTMHRLLTDDGNTP
jgi:two-component system, cell cycle sensor histidine kinase and response regulator CckA